MKKIIFLSLFLSISFAFGQSLRFMYEGEVIEPGDTIDYITVDLQNDNALEFDVINTSDKTLSVWAARENISTVPGSENYFCYEFCFDSSVDTSLYSMEIAAKDTLKNNFSAHYCANGNAGTSLIKYSVFVEDNLSDLTAVYVRFNAMVGINNNTAAHVSLNAFPNPASDNVTLTYQLPQGNMTPSYLVVKNLIGNIVMTEAMPQNSNKMMINVSELTSGVYFYSIEQNNRAILTKKLIVK